MSVDLNCDLGESFGAYSMGRDSLVIPLVSSVNIACGMHAGDPMVMKKTVKMAAAAGIAIGAHPGYPDLQGFGRRDMSLSADEVYAFVLYQIGALSAFCTSLGTRLNHVKPHGQLYNKAAVDDVTAQAIAEAVRDFDPGLVLVGLAGSALIDAGSTAGLAVAGEFFCDRNYEQDGTLVKRTKPHALITDEDFAIERVVQAVQTGTIRTFEGAPLRIQADTICVHGDSSHALAFVTKCRDALTSAGIEICPVAAR